MGNTKEDIESHIITIIDYDNAEWELAEIITLLMEVGPIFHNTKFHVLDLELPYNMILGCPWIHAMQDIPSTFHQCIELKHEGHTVTIQGDL